MKLKFRYSRRATNDLDSIHEYLRTRSPRGAANVMAAIFATIEFIRRYREATPFTRIAGVRGRTVRKYRFKVFYRVRAEEDLIEIVHIRHTSRRPWEGE